MDKAQRKALVEEWKNRCPEMGVISIRCKATGESFLSASKDTKADFNSNRAKLSSGTHPNKCLSALWERYGESGFEFLVIAELKCEDPTKDYTAQLEKMREQCLLEDTNAVKIWR